MSTTESADGNLGLRIVRSLAGLIVLVVAFAIFLALVKTAKEPQRTPLDQVQTRVQTVVVKRVAVARQWEGYGTARAMHAADLSAQITAKVLARPEGIEEGVQVAAGDVIAELDPVDVNSVLLSRQNTALAIESEIQGLDIELHSLNERIELGDDELAIEQRMLDRFNEAQTRGGANPMDVDERQSKVRRLEREIASIRQQILLIDTRKARLTAQLGDARAQIRRAEEDVARATVRSPLTGVVQRIEVEVGELVASGAMIARVVDLRTIEIPLRLPVSSAQSVRVGDRVEVRSDGFSGGRWDGSVARIAPEADATRRTITVYAVVRQRVESDGSLGTLLLPGQFVTARVFSAVSDMHVIVPRSSLDGDRVLALESSVDGGFVARSMPVTIDFLFSGSFPALHPLETQWAAISAGQGVKLPEQVIVSNLETLRDGSNVQPVSVLDGDPARTDRDAAAPATPGAAG